MNKTNVENVLPVDFDGVFRFTNFTDEDFVTRWDGVEYTFPAMKTTPIIIPNLTPVEIQSVRKKFAKDLAVKVFYSTPKFKGMNKVGPGEIPPIYTDADLKEYIQKCLEPLPVGQAKAKIIEKPNEDMFLRKDNKGKKVTRVLEQGESLVGDSSGALE